MKRLFQTLSAIALATASMTVSAYTISLSTGDVDVGALDDVINSTTLSNSGTEELNWVQDILGDSFTLDIKYEESSLTPIAVNGEEDIFAQALAILPPPDYFIVKIGGGGWSGDTHFLYENYDNKSYAVFSLTQFEASCTLVDECSIDIGRVSHVGTSPGATVPEPSALFLMGAGLIGLGFSRRKKLS